VSFRTLPPQFEIHAAAHSTAIYEHAHRSGYSTVANLNPPLANSWSVIPTCLPRPLNQGVEKAWRCASEMGRHIREGRVPEREEAELIVGIADGIDLSQGNGKRERERP
jgi:hypothetical protein